MVAAELAPAHPEIVRIRAANPGPLTLEGTNTYVVGQNPAYVVDPGPDDPSHVAAIIEAVEQRGGLGGVVLTHSHADHTGGVAALGGELLWGDPDEADEASAFADAQSELSVPRSPAHPVRGGDGPGLQADRPPQRPLAGDLSSGDVATARAGPFDVIPTPGHASDHACFIIGEVCFCGDLILGTGSSIVPPAAAGGSLADYGASLRRLGELDLALLCPGHGPWITNPAAKISEYIQHRADREARLVAALDSGESSRQRLLDLAWTEVPAELRPAAALALQAHLEKLAAEGRDLSKLRD